MNKQDIQRAYSNFIGRNIDYCGLIPFSNIPQSFLNRYIK